jgi:hypothetical protein
VAASEQKATKRKQKRRVPRVALGAVMASSGMFTAREWNVITSRILAEMRAAPGKFETMPNLPALPAPHAGRPEFPLQQRIGLEIRRWRIASAEISEELGLPVTLVPHPHSKKPMRRAIMPVKASWLVAFCPSVRQPPREQQLRVWLAVLRIAQRRAEAYAQACEAARVQVLADLEACMVAKE